MYKEIRDIMKKMIRVTPLKPLSLEGNFWQRLPSFLTKIKIMRIRFSFGYMNQTKFGNFTYKLCNKFPFIPTWEFDLFKTYNNSKIPFTIRHSIHIGILKYYWRLEKIKGKWRFTNLTDLHMNKDS